MSVTTLALHVTDRCQLDCAHCLRDPGKQSRDLDFDVALSVIDQAQRLYATRSVALTGGEPTLYPHFIALIDAVASRGLEWHMVTNAARFDWLLERFAELPSRKAALDVVHISLDGSDESTHDAIRGEGSFRDVMRACALARMHDVPFVLQMAVSARTVEQIEAFGLMASQLGARGVSFLPLQATGTPHDATLFLSEAATRAAHSRVVRLRETLKLPVLTPEGWPTHSPFHVCEIFRSYQLHVDVDGRLNLCCQHSGIPSNGAPPSGRSDVIADLRTTPLVDGHIAMVRLIHEVEEAKLRRIADDEVTAWDHHACNWCLKHFGKPHWTDAGASGPEADRERWVGAWGAPKGQSPRARRLPVVA